MVNTLDRFYQGLPTALIIAPESPISVHDLIQENFPVTTDKNNFYYSYRKFIEYVRFFDECIYLTQNKEIVANLANIFFNDFLIRLQGDILDDKNLMKFRTTVQYLIEIVGIIQHPAIFEMVFYFLFGFPEGNKSPSESQVSIFKVSVRVRRA